MLLIHYVSSFANKYAQVLSPKPWLLLLLLLLLVFVRLIKRNINVLLEVMRTSPCGYPIVVAPFASHGLCSFQRDVAQNVGLTYVMSYELMDVCFLIDFFQTH